VLVRLAALTVNVSGFHGLSQEESAGPAALLSRHFNLLLLVQPPLLGGMCAMLFRDAHLTLLEHMVLLAYTLGVRAVALSVIIPIAVLNAASAPSLWQNSGFWAAWYIYFGWGASQFYAGARWRSWLRGMLAAAIGHTLIIGVLVVGSAAYEALTTA